MTGARSTTSALIAKIHVARKQLAMHEDDYRALLRRVTGQGSSAQCSVAQLEAVIAELRALGFKPTGVTSGFGKPHVRLVYALWKDAGRLGAIEHPTKEALRAFVRRQTDGAREAPEFLTPAEAATVSEALKAMIRRAKDQQPKGE